MKYADMSINELEQIICTEKARYEEYKSMGLNYDMTRGKPSLEQLALSDEMMLRCEYFNSGRTKEGADCRNYGGLDGIQDIRELFASIFGVPASQVIAGGNSSLNIMYDLVSAFLLLGTGGGAKPWIEQKNTLPSGTVSFICPVPGYDRHFAITERLGIRMINVNIYSDGPDMDEIERLVKNDAGIKGMWSVPKYSNPTGVIYSDRVIERLASMKCAADDFRIFWDDAYSVHMLEGEPAIQKNLIEACAEAGNPDRAYVFASTSKMTYPGAGIAAVASSRANIEWLKNIYTIQTIGPNKINQLIHANFLKDYDHLIAHMKKHAAIMKPKFECVENVLREELGDSGVLSWSEPKGGYFISADTLLGCADKVVAMCKECGVLFTKAGATYPYGKDPENKNIRIAPSLPPVSELNTAIHVFAICVKICSAEILLEKLRK